jgi:hypothetical protein
MNKKRNILIFISGLLIIGIILSYNIFIAIRNKSNSDNQIIYSSKKLDNYKKLCLSMIGISNTNNSIVPWLGSYPGSGFCGVQNSESFVFLYPKDFVKYFAEHKVFNLIFDISQISKHAHNDPMSFINQNKKQFLVAPVCISISPYNEKQLKVVEFYPSEYIKSKAKNNSNFVVCSDAFILSSFPKLGFIGELRAKNTLFNTKANVSNNIKIGIYLPKDDNVFTTNQISNLADYFLQKPLDFILLDEINLPLH